MSENRAPHGARVLETGRHRLFVVPPAKPGPTVTVLYLLDGNIALKALKPEWLDARPDLAVVAVGYPVDTDFDLEARSRDYTPPPPPHWDGGKRQALSRPHGGAAEFLDLLQGPIRDAAEAALDLVPARRVLWGHSYGGLFGLFALAQGAEGFASIHAASPSLWWGDFMMEQVLAAWLPHDPAATSMVLSIGDGEISSTGERMLAPERLRALSEDLRDRAGLEAVFSIFADAGHRQTLDLSLEQAVRNA